MVGVFRKTIQVTDSSEIYLDPPYPDARLLTVDWPTTWRVDGGKVVGYAQFTWVVDEV